MNEIDIINNIIRTKIKDKSDNSPSSELTHEDISKVTYEEYIGQDKGAISFFFYSSGKVGNNKPFRLKNIAIEDYIKLKDMISSNRGTEDIFAIDSSTLVENEQSEASKVSEENSPQESCFKQIVQEAIEQDDVKEQSVIESLFPLRDT